jgi:ribosomal protein L37AE/L43A
MSVVREDEYIKIRKGEASFECFCPECNFERDVIKTDKNEYYCLKCGNIFTSNEKNEVLDKITKKLMGTDESENPKFYGETVLEETSD